MRIGPARGRLLTGCACVVLVTAAGWAVLPRAASAHAELVSAQPAPGSSLGLAPSAVVLRYSESVDARFSSAFVISPGGHRYRSSVSDLTMRVHLPTNEPGVYRVAWKAVSADDGHTVRGSYRFAVRTTLLGSAGTGGSGKFLASDVVLAATRIIESIALLFAGGFLLLGLLARRRPALAWMGEVAGTRLRIALAVAFGAAVLVVIGEAAQAEGSLPPAALGHFLGEGFPGAVRSARLALEGAGVAFAAGSVLVATGVAVTGALVALAASGHAAALHDRWLGIATNAGHLVAAAVWVGGIMAIATMRPPGGWRGQDAKGLLRAFSPFALSAFGVAVVLGGAQAIQELGSLRLLWTTTYGRVLLIKMSVIAAMIPLSLLAWRRRQFGRTEAALGMGAIAVAALLSMFSPAPRPAPAMAGMAEAARAPAVQTHALPGSGELTLGGNAGEYLVGVTLGPGRASSRELAVYVRAPDPGAAGARVRLLSNDRRVRLRGCARGCRVDPFPIRPHEVLRVRVLGPRGGVAAFALPELPAPSARSLLARAIARMERVRTYRMRETVSTAGGRTIHSRYAFEASGRRLYVRNGAKGPWRMLRGGPSRPVRSYVWDFIHPLSDSFVIGHEGRSGQRTTTVACFGRSGEVPVWSRLWITRGGLIVRVRAWSVGRFLDDRLFGFGAPISITPSS